MAVVAGLAPLTRMDSRLAWTGGPAAPVRRSGGCGRPASGGARCARSILRLIVFGSGKALVSENRVTHTRLQDT